MGSRTVCSAVGCESSKAHSFGKLMHRFPKEVELCKKWIQLLCPSNLLPLADMLNESSKRICSDHFKREDYIWVGCRFVLRKGAIPIPNPNKDLAGKCVFQRETSNTSPISVSPCKENSGCFNNHSNRTSFDHAYCKSDVFETPDIFGKRKMCVTPSTRRKIRIVENRTLETHNLCHIESGERENVNTLGVPVSPRKLLCNPDDCLFEKNNNKAHSWVSVDHDYCKSGFEEIPDIFGKRKVSSASFTARKIEVVETPEADLEREFNIWSPFVGEKDTTTNVHSEFNISSFACRRKLNFGTSHANQSPSSISAADGCCPLSPNAMPSSFFHTRTISMSQPICSNTPIAENYQPLRSQKTTTEYKPKRKPKPKRTPESKEERKRKLISKQKLLLREFGYSKKEMTPRKENLFKVAQAYKKALGRLKNKNNSIALELKEKVLNPLKAFYKNNNLSPLLMQLIEGELKNSKKRPRGRRWTADEKSLAVALYKRAPRHYNFLRKLICLPSKSSITRHLNKIPFEVGINSKIFDHLKTRAEGMNPRDRTCSLAFDEMAIKASLFYNAAKDCIDGYEDYGNQGRTSKVADHGLLFMLQGIRSSWKMPICYYFSSGSVPRITLKALIREIVKEVFKTTLSVAASICDQGPTNRSAMKELMDESGRTGFHFTVEGKRIVIIFDLPHLLKNTRNNFLKYDVSLDGLIRRAKWSWIKTFFMMDQGIARMAYKLTKTHMNPIGKAKMKVKLAAQVFSHTVAAGITSLVRGKKMDKDAMYTANFVHMFDKLFDSFNGSSKRPRDGKPYRTCLHRDSEHFKLWSYMKDFLSLDKTRMMFLNESEEKLKRVKPPSQGGWVQSIGAVTELFEKLSKEEDLVYLNMRNLNQDKVENTFSEIRQHGAFNTNPTSDQFSAALKTLIVNNMSSASSKSQSSNCEADDGELLSDLKTFLSDPETTKNIQNLASKVKNDSTSNSVVNNINQDEENKLVDHYSIERPSYAYITGFMIKRFFSTPDIKSCSACTEILIAKDFTCDHFFISEKEYRSYTNLLHYPTRAVIDAAIDCVGVLYSGQPQEILRQSFPQANLVKGMVARMADEVEWNWLSCDKHKAFIIEHLSTSVCRIFIKSWCKKFRIALAQFKEEERRKRLEKKKMKEMAKLGGKGISEDKGKQCDKRKPTTGKSVAQTPKVGPPKLNPEIAPSELSKMMQSKPIPTTIAEEQPKTGQTVKNMRWTKEVCSDLIRCYLKITAMEQNLETDWKTHTCKMFKSHHPNAAHLTESRICAIIREIKKGKYLSISEFQQIKDAMTRETMSSLQKGIMRKC